MDLDLLPEIKNQVNYTLQLITSTCASFFQYIVYPSMEQERILLKRNNELNKTLQTLVKKDAAPEDKLSIQQKIYAQEELIHSRDNYFRINQDNLIAHRIYNVIFNLEMTEYVINTILPFSIVTKLNKKIDAKGLPSLLKIEGEFIKKLDKDLKIEYESLFRDGMITKESTQYILSTLQKFLSFLLLKDDNTIMSEAEINKNIQSIKHKAKNIREDIIINIPVDHGFKIDNNNIICQSMIYVLAGLTDWLGKNEVDRVDIRFLKDIILPRKLTDEEEKYKPTIQELKQAEERIYEGLINNDLYPTPIALVELSKLLYIISNNKELINYTKQFSLVL